jgi:hypothetical protein
MFMASDLLLQYLWHGTPHQHTIAHDLESFVYIFIYICVIYDGPGDKLREDKIFMETIVHLWINGEWAILASVKLMHMQLLDQFIYNVTPYFQPFSTLITNLCLLVSTQILYCSDVDPRTTPPLTHQALMSKIQPFINSDNGNNDDEPLTIHTSIRRLVFNGQAPSFVTEGDRLLAAPKLKQHCASHNDQSSAKRPRNASRTKASTTHANKESTAATRKLTAHTTRESATHAASRGSVNSRRRG